VSAILKARQRRRDDRLNEIAGLPVRPLRLLSVAAFILVISSLLGSSASQPASLPSSAPAPSTSTSAPASSAPATSAPAATAASVLAPSSVSPSAQLEQAPSAPLRATAPAPEQPVTKRTPKDGPQLVWPAIALAGAGGAGLIGAGAIGVVAASSWGAYLDARHDIVTVDGADYTRPGLQRTYFEAQLWTAAAAVVATLSAAALGAGLTWQLLALENDAAEEATP